MLKAKNCLVFQGQIEAIATMTPKERCVVLDEFSGYVYNSCCTDACYQCCMLYSCPSLTVALGFVTFVLILGNHDNYGRPL